MEVLKDYEIEANPFRYEKFQIGYALATPAMNERSRAVSRLEDLETELYRFLNPLDESD